MYEYTPHSEPGAIYAHLHSIGDDSILVLYVE
jgi:hypothetical protein